MSNPNRSTGPITAEGKFNSSKNSVTHGLTAQNIDRFPESIREAYRAFLAQQFAEIQPETCNEELYLTQYAFAQFQLLRAQPILIAASEAALANPGDEAAEKRLARIARHTRSLERTAKDALKELRIFIQNRLASVAANETLAGLAGPSVQFPVAFPHHLLTQKKDLRQPIADNALRFALSRQTALQAKLAA